MNRILIETLSRVWFAFHEKVQHALPRFLAALTLILVGWAFAVVVRRVLLRSLRLVHFDQRFERSGLGLPLRRAGLVRSPAELLARFAFWVVFLSGGILAASAMEMPVLDRMVAAFFLFLPRFFVALVILAIGFLSANFLARAALLLAVNEDLPHPGLLGGMVRMLVNLLSLTMALEQVGIAASTASLAFGIAFGAPMLALAIAFGLGGRDLARDFLSRRGPEPQGEGSDGMRHV